MGEENNNYINGYVRDQNNHPISFDTEGNLVDQVSGEKGTMMLPGFTVTGISPETRAKNYSTSFDGTYGLTPRDIYGLMPIVGDALDIKDIGIDLYNGDYINAGIGAGLFLLPNIVERPLKMAGRFTKNLYTNSPKYIFDHLPYKTIDKVQGTLFGFKNDAITFLSTPLNENPIKAVKNRRKELQIGKSPRTDVYPNAEYDTFIGSSMQNSDPIYQIRNRLRTRMNNKNYLYSYPNDGFGIYLDDNMYNSDYIISEIPIKDYLSLKDVYKLGIDKQSGLMDKIINMINTPINYVKVNTEPAFAYRGNNRFIKVNKKALNDFGLDYNTVVSHEYNHALRNIYPEADSSIKDAFNYDHLIPRYKNYLSNPTEIEARGTQLKNYFDSDIITPDMLKYASQHYVPDTKQDNNMYQFFSGIKDWDKAAKYLSKFSLKRGGKMNIIPKRQYKTGISIGINTYGFKNG